MNPFDQDPFDSRKVSKTTIALLIVAIVAVIVLYYLIP